MDGGCLALAGPPQWSYEGGQRGMTCWTETCSSRWGDEAGYGWKSKEEAERKLERNWGRLPVCVASLAYLHDIDHERIIFNRVHDPVGSLSDAVAILTRELLASGRTRITRQRSDTGYHTLAVPFLGDRLDLSYRRWLDENPISCHCVSGPLQHLQTKDSAQRPDLRRRPDPPHPLPETP